MKPTLSSASPSLHAIGWPISPGSRHRPFVDDRPSSRTWVSLPRDRVQLRSTVDRGGQAGGALTARRRTATDFPMITVRVEVSPMSSFLKQVGMVAQKHIRLGVVGFGNQFVPLAVECQCIFAYGRLQGP